MARIREHVWVSHGRKDHTSQAIPSINKNEVMGGSHWVGSRTRRHVWKSWMERSHTLHTLFPRSIGMTYDNLLSLLEVNGSLYLGPKH